MTSFTKLATAGILAVTLLTGSAAPAAAQVQAPGGDEECDYTLVIDSWIWTGSMPIPAVWHVEVTCVRIIDDNV